MRYVLAVVLLVCSVSFAFGADYTVIEKINRPYSGRHRLLMKIRATDANTGEAILETMMDAAMDAQKAEGAHAVNVKLYRDVKGSADGIITYSVDGCGWANRECNAGNNWSQVMVWDPYRPGHLVFNKIPDRLKDYGRPTGKQMKAAKAGTCKADLNCWDKKHRVDAITSCQIMIEVISDRARYKYKWTTGWLEHKFSRVSWPSGEKGGESLAYWGNKLEMQNKYGAWVPFTYWCRYNPTTKRSKVTHLAPR